MPKLTCPDGHEINLSPIPNPHGYVLIREPAIESLVDRLTGACQSAAASPTDQSFPRQAYAALSSRNPEIMHAYECPVCGRIAIFASASDETPIAWYRREP